MQSCYGSLQICRLRISALKDCKPDCGPNKGYVSTSTIQLNIALDVEQGQQFTQKTGCGEVCIDVRDCDRLKGFTWDMELCSVDHELMSLLIGSSLINVGGVNIGHLSPDQDSCPPPVVVEWWSKRVAKGNCIASADLPYWHWAIPWNEAQIGGNLNFSNNITNFMVKGYGRENPYIGVGPWGDWPVPINDRLYGMWGDTGLPAANCGLIDVPC